MIFSPVAVHVRERFQSVLQWVYFGSQPSSPSRQQKTGEISPHALAEWARRGDAREKTCETRRQTADLPENTMTGGEETLV